METYTRTYISDCCGAGVLYLAPDYDSEGNIEAIRVCVLHVTNGAVQKKKKLKNTHMSNHSQMYSELGGRPKYGELVGGLIGIGLFTFTGILLLVATH